MVMTNSERVDAFKDLIEKVARFAVSNYPDIDRKDIEQELYVLILSKKSIPTPDEDPGKASTALYYAGKAAARKQRAEHLWITSQYSYTKDDVKSILNDHYSVRSEWQGAYVPDDARSEDNTDDINIRSDIAWAYDLLSDEYKKAILKRYGLNEVPSGSSPEGRMLRRAVDKLVHILNSYSRSYREGPGKRHPISNATARAIIEEQT